MDRTPLRSGATLTRREFIKTLATAGVTLATGGIALREATAADPAEQATSPPWFQVRAAMLGEGELLAMDWPALAREIGLTTLDLTYLAPSWLTTTDLGKRTVAACSDRGIGIEYGFHVVSWALPRELFAKNPDMFRMDDSGNRTNGANLCVHSQDALEIVGQHMAEYVSPMPTTTGRYFFWIDDGQPMCRCPKCKALSDSDQAIILENAILRAVRTVDPGARVCHLAYSRTLPAPTQVRPDPGVFLQFAPIERVYDKPLSDPGASAGPSALTHGRALECLDANLAWFGSDTADVLEYWLDNSRFCGWKRENLARVPWHPEVFLEDLRTYATRGIRSLRTYAFWFDKEYLDRFGEPPIREYAAGLLKWREVDGKPVES